MRDMSKIPEWVDYNIVLLRGRLGRDPEVKTTTGGLQIVNVSLATSERWTDKRTGENMEKTEWHRCVVKFNDVAVNAAMNLAKGQRAIVEGKIVTRKWTDQTGAERFATEIEVGRFGSIEAVPEEPRDDPGEGYAPARVRGKPASSAPPTDHLDDEIPF